MLIHALPSGAPPSATDGRRLCVSVVGALLLHAAAADYLKYLRPLALPPRGPTPATLVSIELNDPPPSLPAAAPPPEARPQRVASAPIHHRGLASPILAPPARAAAVLTRSPSPEAPVDLTGVSFVVGSASTYSGGITPSGEVAPSSAAVSSTTALTPQPRIRVAPVSRARAAALDGAARWQCSFPSGEEAADLDTAVVLVRVTVDARGGVRAVKVLSDPGQGFGPQAEHCARSRSWAPALDDDGHPIEGEVTVRVHFER